MKKIGFLSFGHWTPSPQSQVRTAADALLQSIELAVAAEELGADGAYFRVHHFARQLGSPFPLLAAVGARTKKIEIGTAVIDMRYENPLYMAEDAGAADLIAGGRLQLGISRGSPEQVIDGWRYFGYAPAEGETHADMARRHAEVFLAGARRRGVRQTEPAADVSQSARAAAPRAAFRGAARADLVGLQLERHVQVGRETGHVPSELDPQGRRERRAAARAAAQADRSLSGGVEGGRAPREPRVSVSRSIFALVNDLDRAYFGRDGRDQDQIGYIDANTRAIFGRSYAAEPEELVKQLAADEAIAAADTLLLTVPNQLGVEYNAHAIESILKFVAPELGWR